MGVALGVVGAIVVAAIVYGLFKRPGAGRQLQPTRDQARIGTGSPPRQPPTATPSRRPGSPEGARPLAAGGAVRGAAAASETFWLMGVKGSVAGQAFLVGQRTLTIGRIPTNLIQVVDDDVSRRHTQLRPMGDHVLIVDMNSHNGTYVNGQRVGQAEMRAGDTLDVGGCRFRLEQRAAAGADAAMLRKEADAKKFDSTVSSAGTNLADLVRETLKKKGGDFEEAGKAIGVEPDVLRYLATQMDLED